MLLFCSIRPISNLKEQIYSFEIRRKILVLCHFFQRKLDGYEFPVYSTEYCPRNLTEWNERSSAINCTESKGYMCLPNKNLSELLEFCYIHPFIWIEEGIQRDNYYQEYAYVWVVSNERQYIQRHFNSVFYICLLINADSISGICLYLMERASIVNSYSCRHFMYGCPNSSFQSFNMFECKCIFWCNKPYSDQHNNL